MKNLWHDNFMHENEISMHKNKIYMYENKHFAPKFSFPCMKQKTLPPKTFVAENSWQELVYCLISHEHIWGEKEYHGGKIFVFMHGNDIFMHEILIYAWKLYISMNENFILMHESFYGTLVNHNKHKPT